MIVPILSVKDFDASLKFYTEKLGFNSDFNFQGPDGSNVFGLVSRGKEVQFGLELEPPNSAVRGNGVLLMVYPENFDIESYYAEVKKNGVAIEEDLQEKYWGDKVFSVKDPDGYHLMFSKTIEQPPSNEEIQDYMKQQR